MASIEKRGNLYSIRFRATVDGIQKNMRLSGFRTKKEARLAYEKAIREGVQSKSKKLQSNPEMRFEDLVEKFVEWKGTQLKPSSLTDLESRVNNNILPFFETMYVREISPEIITDWQISLKKFSYNTKKILFSCLKSIFEFGRKRYKIPSPMQDVDPFRNSNTQKQIQFWTPEEFLTFIDFVDNKMYHALFTFLYNSGCRIGEALALTKDDIDLENNSVKIYKSVSRKFKGETFSISGPKNTASFRTVFLPAPVIQELSELAGDKNFIFSHGDAPITSSGIRKYFGKVIKLSGVKKIRIHDLRHSCASLLISQGNSIKAVSAHLGHAKTQQTLNTYAHLFPQDTQKIVDSLEKAVYKKTP